MPRTGLRPAGAAVLIAGLWLSGCAREAPSGAPSLVTSRPAAGEEGVAPSAWIRLQFSSPLSFHARESVELACEGARVPVAVYQLAPGQIAVDPRGDLPRAARCAVSWSAAARSDGISFVTAAAEGSEPFVVYDRFDRRQRAPFPDDFWLRADPSQRTGYRLAIDFREFAQESQRFVDKLLEGTENLDGFSPIAHLTVELSEPPDPASLPRTPAASLLPDASVGLFDLTPGSARYGQRVPFRLEARTATSWGNETHCLLLFPSGSLTPGGRYGLVVTRRVLTRDGRPFEPSPFFRSAREGPPVRGEPRPLRRARRHAGEVLAALEQAAHPPLSSDDVALAVRFSVRSTDDIPADLLALKEDVLAAPPPKVTVLRVEPESEEELARGSAVAAIVIGTWEAPDWRDAANSFARDANGRPRRTGVREIPFVLALPRAAKEHPVPVSMYQHGNPGSAEEEVVEHARLSLAAAGFAVIGFTDPLNREVSPPGKSREQRANDQVVNILWHTVAAGEIPDYFIQTTGEQLAFLRAIEELAKRERFEPDGGGQPLFGIDPEKPLTYVGVSEGANHAPALLSSAPEIRAAALVAGGRRFTEVLMHQQPHTFLAPLYLLGFEEFTPTDIWVVFALFQTVFDSQDPHNYAPYVYREPLEVAGTTRKASILLVEGIGDTLVPNHVTESLGWALGPIPQVGPVIRRVPFLELEESPVAGNVDPHTTAGLVQYAPVGVDGVAPTPGCQSPPLSVEGSRDAHVCAQNAEESLRQRVVFLESALTDEAPRIIDPMAREALAN